MNLSLDQLVFEELASLTGLAGWRGQYLDSLFEAQELYLELLIRGARGIVIHLGGQPIGYFLLDPGATLLEYYLTPENLARADDIFGLILHKFAVQKALCKSFDHTLLSCCAGFQKQTSVTGILFRDYQPQSPRRVVGGLTARPATAADGPRIIAVNEEIFEQEEEVWEYIAKGQILLFEQVEELVGFGVCARVIPGRPDFDIGMLVVREYRRRGYAEAILRHLVTLCEQNGWRPICGCAVENTGSRRSLENAGFVSRHRLLEFGF